LHVIKTVPYIAAILNALHSDVGDEDLDIENSISAFLRGNHPEQLNDNQMIATATPLKLWSPLLQLAIR
jgi:hypothetical protein